MPTLKPTKKFKMFSLVSLAYLIFIISLGISYAYLDYHNTRENDRVGTKKIVNIF